MTPEMLVAQAALLALGLLLLAFILTVWRIAAGPSLTDRVVGLDMLSGIAIGFIAVVAIRSSEDLYVDIAVALCLVGFLTTLAFARFIISRHGKGEDDGKGTETEKGAGT